ncbi:MAG: hypothetical protein QXZ70_00620 [Candidatus Bathyarchaeia archaeon]
MKVEDFRLEVEEECRRQGLPKPEIMEERPGSIKLRISLARDAHIDLYFNEDTKTITSALVVNGKRVFGINGYPRVGQWHLHPKGDAQKHVRTTPMTIERIMKEYSKAISKLKIKRM